MGFLKTVERDLFLYYFLFRFLSFIKRKKNYRQILNRPFLLQQVIFLFIYIFFGIEEHQFLHVLLFKSLSYIYGERIADNISIKDFYLHNLLFLSTSATDNVNLCFIWKTWSLLTCTFSSTGLLLQIISLPSAFVFLSTCPLLQILPNIIGGQMNCDCIFIIVRFFGCESCIISCYEISCLCIYIFHYKRCFFLIFFIKF